MIMVRFSSCHRYKVCRTHGCTNSSTILLDQKKLPQPTATVPSGTAKEEDDRLTKTPFIQTVIPIK